MLQNGGNEDLCSENSFTGCEERTGNSSVARSAILHELFAVGVHFLGGDAAAARRTVTIRNLATSR